MGAIGLNLNEVDALVQMQGAFTYAASMLIVFEEEWNRHRMKTQVLDMKAARLAAKNALFCDAFIGGEAPKPFAGQKVGLLESFARPQAYVNHGVPQRVLGTVSRPRAAPLNDTNKFKDDLRKLYNLEIPDGYVENMGAAPVFNDILANAY